MTESKKPNKPNKPNKPSMLDIVKSVAASAFGVQSAKNRERDFQQQSIVPYIVVGVVFVLLFIAGLIVLVSQIVPS
jgi:diacylglycerol kinase